MNENNKSGEALDRAMRLCSVREYCKDDILRKLKAWDITDTDCKKIIDTLQKGKFIDERRYAGAFVRDKYHYNKWGKGKIASLLRMKKIPEQIIKSSLELIDNEQYIDTIKRLLDTRRKSVKAKNQYDLKGKLLRYGLSKGFEKDILYELLNNYD